MTRSHSEQAHPRLQRTKECRGRRVESDRSADAVLCHDAGPIPDASMNYRGEVLRLIAQMGLGTAALAMVGGTVVIVGFLTMTTGALVAVQGYNQFARSVGVEALTGFASAFFNVRLIAPGPPRSRCRPPSVPAPPLSSARCGSTRRSTRSR